MSAQPGPSRRGARRRFLSAIQDSLGVIFQAALIALKLAGIITGPWWWILAPLWIGIAQSAAAAILLSPRSGEMGTG